MSVFAGLLIAFGEIEGNSYNVLHAFLAGFVLLSVGILYIYISQKLKKRSYMARSTELILSSLIIIEQIIGTAFLVRSIIRLFIFLTIHFFIISYLLFNKEAKKFFK